MGVNAETFYHNIELSEELLTSFAKALVPEIRNFYNSAEGRDYFETWLKSHPEFDDTAHSTSEKI